MAISADTLRGENGGMNNTNITAIASATGRGTVTRISSARRSPRTRTDVLRARDARRQIRSREERFAHLKRMYD